MSSAQNERSSYRKLIIQTNNVNVRVTISSDPDNPPPAGLEPDQTVEAVYNPIAVPAGFYLTMLKGLDRDVSVCLRVFTSHDISKSDMLIAANIP